jgi:GTP cyclohydrolase I
MESVMKMRKDPELGKMIYQHLIDQGVETPMKKKNWTPAQRRTTIEYHFDLIMKALDLDMEDDSLIGTPERVGRMFVDEIFYGLDYDNFPKITTIENKMTYDSMIVERHIGVASSCEHHFVVIDGFAHIAYIPQKKVIGLSKLNRIVEFFSKRPQVQERLTEQIYYALQYLLETDHIAVMINATHYCVKSRGIKDINASTITSKLGGHFRDGVVRNEFMHLIHD